MSSSRHTALHQERYWYTIPVNFFHQPLQILPVSLLLHEAQPRTICLHIRCMPLNSQPSTRFTVSLVQELPFQRWKQEPQPYQLARNVHTQFAPREKICAQGGAANDFLKVLDRSTCGHTCSGPIVVREKSGRSKNGTGSSTERRKSHPGNPQCP